MDLLDHHRVFNAGDNPDGSAAGPTGLDVNAKNPLEALCPAHRGPALGGCVLFCALLRTALVALSSFARCHPRTVLAVGGEHAVEAGEVHPGLGHHLPIGI